jgi:hypothetical protein
MGGIMSRSVNALKDILRRSESLLEKLKKTVPTMAHAKSAALLRQIIQGKKKTIQTYKSILKEAQKCPAVKKKTAKKGAAKEKKPTLKSTKGGAKTRSKKGAAKK